MNADKGNTASAPSSVAERIAALQNDNDKMSSYTTSSAAHKLPAAARPPKMSERINTLALADRIAMFENTRSKTSDDSRSDDGAYDLPRDELDAEDVAVIKLDNDEEESGLKDDGSNVKRRDSTCNESASELPVVTIVPLRCEMHNNFSPSEQEKLQDTNATSNNVSISFDSLSAEYLESAWNSSPEKCRESIEDPGWSGGEWTAEWPNGDEFEAKVVAVKELLTENQQTEKQQKPSLVSEARVALLARRAARQGQEVATEVSMNVSGEESLQSDCTSIFYHRSFLDSRRGMFRINRLIHLLYRT